MHQVAQLRDRGLHPVPQLARLAGDVGVGGGGRQPPRPQPDDVTAYGAQILAVADGTVVSALSTLPDQKPGSLPDPSTITLDTVDGNHVVLDLGGGSFAFYAHMQPGSVRVREGQHVRRG